MLYEASHLKKPIHLVYWLYSLENGLLLFTCRTIYFMGGHALFLTEMFTQHLSCCKWMETLIAVEKVSSDLILLQIVKLKTNKMDFITVLIITLQFVIIGKIEFISIDLIQFNN